MDESVTLESRLEVGSESTNSGSFMKLIERVIGWHNEMYSPLPIRLFLPVVDVRVVR